MMFGKKKLAKSIAVYISDRFGHIIIAPQYENDAGIIYEQNLCFATTYPINSVALGEEVIKQLDLYSHRDVNLRNSKQSDWPAYKHSKSKSIRAFEKDYIHIGICSINESNLILTLEASPHKDSELKISSTISFYEDKLILGERINEIYEACLKEN